MLRFETLLARLGRHELVLLGAFLVVAALIFFFMELADEMAEGETQAFDEWILLALRAPGDTADPIGPPWVEVMFTDITSLGSTAVLTLITAAVALYLLMARKRGAAVFVLAAVGGGTLLSNVLKYAYARPRPDVVAHIVQTTTPSFPSGHAMLTAVTYLTLGALLARTEPDPRLKVYLVSLAVFLTVLVGCSRIYLGVHYPTDVLAGWTVGAAWAVLCSVVALWLQRRGEVEPG